jgi:hypothetical protein
MDDYIVLDDLKNSVDYMCSDDWKQRLIAEYAQLVTRLEDLLETMYAEEWEETKLLDCPTGILDMQVERMDAYKQILEIRAELYGINLEYEVEKLNT